MDALYLLVAVALGLAGGAWLGTRLGRARGGDGGAQRAATEEAEKIRSAARVEIEAVKQAAEVEGKEAARKRRAELDEELRARRTELQKREEGLTQREREVLRLLASGLRNEEIGKRLYLSPETVRAHIRKATQKLGAETRTEAVALAIRCDLIS